MADVYQRVSPSDQWIYDDNTGDLIGVRRRGMNGADLRVDGLSTGQLADLTGASTATPTSSDTVVGVQGGVVKRFYRDALGPFVNVKDPAYGAVGDGSTDDAAAIESAIATGKIVYFPKPATTYLIGRKITVGAPVAMVGDGKSATVLERGYSPTVDSDGIFNFTGGGTVCTIAGMTLRSKTGQTGGCLVSIVSGASDTLGLYRFDDVDFTTTGTSTHAYTVYMDGTAKTSAPIGIRGVDFVGCSVFGGATSTMLIKGVLKFSFLGGGCYTAGGAASSNVNFTGDATVKTQSFLFAPADNSCPLNFDYATLGRVQCGVSGAITNTTNASYITGVAYATSVDSNWTDSTFLLAGGTLTHAGGITAKGSVASVSRALSVTSIGTIGSTYTTATADQQSFDFSPGSGKMFHIATGGGAAALCFADYKSATITLVSNPSSEFENSSTPTAGKTGVYKSVNNHAITVLNNTGGAVNYSILVLGAVTGNTDPA